MTIVELVSSADLSFGGDQFVHERFAQQARLTPTAPALVFATEAMSYAALEQASNRLAHVLRAAGVGPERRVGLLFERSPLMIVAVLAVFKAGGAYVPFDPQQPLGRLQVMVEDAELHLLLCERSLKAHLPAHAVAVLVLDEEQERLAQQPSTPPVVALSPTNLAYMIYTSGSSGQPKGVLVTHQGIVNLIDQQIAAFELRPGSRVLQFASLSFDASVSEIWTTLLAGATLCLVSVTDGLLGPDLRRILQDYAITMVTLPPSVLAILDPRDFPCLQTVVSAGEACSVETVARWGVGRRLINAYGPTEATVCATMALDVADQVQISIGRALSQTSVYLVDADGQPVMGDDAVGEIWLTGPGIARGYHNQPALTAERFGPNPFDPSSPYRVYQTGDQGRWLPDGSLEFIGRQDHQIKLRGFRIEPGEIENLLCLYPNVRQAVVTVRADQAKNERLVAYLLGDGQKELSMNGLRAYTKALLPNYMIPSAFVVVESFPLNTNGKVDVAVLPAPDFNNMQRETAYVAPRNELEATITAIWEEILGFAPIGMHDNFFDIGGHSLLATRIISTLRQRLQIEVPLSVILNVEPTIAETARILEEFQLTQADPDELLALLQELDGLSEADVQALLASEGVGAL